MTILDPVIGEIYAAYSDDPRVIYQLFPLFAKLSYGKRRKTVGGRSESKTFGNLIKVDRIIKAKRIWSAEFKHVIIAYVVMMNMFMHTAIDSLVMDFPFYANNQIGFMESHFDCFWWFEIDLSRTRQVTMLNR